MKHFFPSCTVIRTWPRESAELARYLESRHGIRAAGCCRTGRAELGPDDTAYAVCHTCSVILSESSSAGAVDFVWSLIDDDPKFDFPDLGGAEMAVQDCWVTADRADEQDAVRSILRKMNVRTLELPEAREHTKFCGARLYSECPERNRELASGRLVRDAAPHTRPMSAAEAASEMRRYVGDLPTDRVVCYCAVCRMGLEAGGARVSHLLELLFP